MTYRERREARAEKLRGFSDKRRVKASEAFGRSHSMMDAIPFGQPILVGHHSERRDRNYRNRAWNMLGKGVEHSKTADSMESRADNIESALERAIYDDDPDALERLREKLAALKEMRERNKTFAKTHVFIGESRWREGKVGKKIGQRTGFVTVEYPDGTTDEVARAMVHPALPSYSSSNLNGNISRVRERIRHLESRANLIATRYSYEANGATVADTRHPDYVEVAYPDRPSRERLDELKAAGFQWSKGAWFGQRSKLPERYQNGTTSDLDPTGWRVGDETFATFHEAEDAAFGIASVPFSPEPC